MGLNTKGDYSNYSIYLDIMTDQCFVVHRTFVETGCNYKGDYSIYLGIMTDQCFIVH